MKCSRRQDSIFAQERSSEIESENFAAKATRTHSRKQCLTFDSPPPPLQETKSYLEELNEAVNVFNHRILGAFQILTLGKEREPRYSAVRILESGFNSLRRIEFIRSTVEKQALGSNLTMKLLLITPMEH